MRHIWGPNAKGSKCGACGLVLTTSKERGPRGGFRMEWRFRDGRVVVGGNTPPCPGEKKK